jgi:putative phosphoesterase
VFPCPALKIIIWLKDEGTVVDGMLIGIMSDTHDNIAQTKKAVARFNREGVEHVLHAGDFVSPFMIDTLKDLAAPLTGVFGNNDGDRVLIGKKSASFPNLKIAGTFARIDAGGMRIALLHGNDPALLETLAGCSSLDLLVYGHTHRPELRRQGSLLIVNPGEVYGHLTGRSTVALVDTVKRSAEIVEI